MSVVFVQVMDVDRKRKDGEELAGKQRLVEESELPDWLVKDEEEVINGI